MTRSIAAIKSTVYSLLEVATTKQVKKLYPEFDLRQRASWLEIETDVIGKEPRMTLDEFRAEMVDMRLADELNTAHNEMLTTDFLSAICATAPDDLDLDSYHDLMVDLTDCRKTNSKGSGTCSKRSPMRRKPPSCAAFWIATINGSRNFPMPTAAECAAWIPTSV